MTTQYKANTYLYVKGHGCEYKILEVKDGRMLLLDIDGNCEWYGCQEIADLEHADEPNWGRDICIP